MCVKSLFNVLIKLNKKNIQLQNTQPMYTLRHVIKNDQSKPRYLS